jgi:hypothetical protein
MKTLSIPRRLPARFLLPGVALLIAATALAAALVLHHDLRIQARRQGQQESTLTFALRKHLLSAAPQCGAEVAYVRALPSSVSLDQFAQTLQDSAEAFNVSVRSVAGEPRSRGARSLAALDVNIAMQGPYLGIKAALAEALVRFPTGAVTHLHVKRDGLALPPVEDATVQVAFALQPPTSGPPDCTVAATKESP